MENVTDRSNRAVYEEALGILATARARVGSLKGYFSFSVDWCKEMMDGSFHDKTAKHLMASIHKSAYTSTVLNLATQHQYR